MIFDEATSYSLSSFIKKQVTNVNIPISHLFSFEVHQFIDPILPNIILPNATLPFSYHLQMSRWKIHRLLLPFLSPPFEEDNDDALSMSQNAAPLSSSLSLDHTISLLSIEDPCYAPDPLLLNYPICMLLNFPLSRRNLSQFLHSLTALMNH